MGVFQFQLTEDANSPRRLAMSSMAQTGTTEIKSRSTLPVPIPYAHLKQLNVQRWKDQPWKGKGNHWNTLLTSLTGPLDQFAPMKDWHDFLPSREIVGITTTPHSQLKHDPILRFGLWLVLGSGRVPKNITFISASLGDRRRPLQTAPKTCVHHAGWWEGSSVRTSLNIYLDSEALEHEGFDNSLRFKRCTFVLHSQKHLGFCLVAPSWCCDCWAWSTSLLNLGL